MCGCNSTPAPPAERYEVKLPNGNTFIVNSEHEARVEVTKAGGGTFSRV